MEYLIGSLLTFVIMVTASYISRSRDQEQITTIRYSQSHVHELIQPFLPSNEEMRQQKPSQSSKHVEDMFIRVVFLDDKAYWIKDGKFYVADAGEDGVDKANATEVDTMTMDAIQLNKIKFIVEKLTEGKDNDSRNAG